MRSGGVGAARHRGGPGITPRGGGVSPIRSADRPRQPLWGGDQGGGGGGGGRHPVRGPGRNPLLVVVAGRAGTPRHPTRGLRSGRGSHGWKGRGPSAVDSTPSGRPQNIPIRASKKMTCPNLRELGAGQGRGVSLVVFRTPLLLV